VCASTYVNGRRRKFFEKNFRALSRLDDAKEKSKITAPPRAGSLAVCQDVAIANHASIEKKGLRRNPDDLNLIATGNSEKTISALAERMFSFLRETRIIGEISSQGGASSRRREAA